MDIPIIIPGNMRFQIRNRTAYFELHRIMLPKELMGVLTNHVWAEGYLKVFIGVMFAGEEYNYMSYRGHIGISSYEEKSVERDMLVLEHVHFVLHLIGGE
jgi:hypothetical protein